MILREGREENKVGVDGLIPTPSPTLLPSMQIPVTMHTDKKNPVTIRFPFGISSITKRALYIPPKTVLAKGFCSFKTSYSLSAEIERDLGRDETGHVIEVSVRKSGPSIPFRHDRHDEPRQIACAIHKSP